MYRNNLSGMGADFIEKQHFFAFFFFLLNIFFASFFLLNKKMQDATRHDLDIFDLINKVIQKIDTVEMYNKDNYGSENGCSEDKDAMLLAREEFEHNPFHILYKQTDMTYHYVGANCDEDRDWYDKEYAKEREQYESLQRVLKYNNENIAINYINRKPIGFSLPAVLYPKRTLEVANFTKQEFDDMIRIVKYLNTQDYDCFVFSLFERRCGCGLECERRLVTKHRERIQATPEIIDELTSHDLLDYDKHNFFFQICVTKASWQQQLT